MRGRAASTDTLNSSDPASDTVNRASAATLTEWATTSRRNGPVPNMAAANREPQPGEATWRSDANLSVPQELGCPVVTRPSCRHRRRRLGRDPSCNGLGSIRRRPGVGSGRRPGRSDPLPAGVDGRGIEASAVAVRA